MPSLLSSRVARCPWSGSKQTIFIPICDGLIVGSCIQVNWERMGRLACDKWRLYGVRRSRKELLPSASMLWMDYHVKLSANDASFVLDVGMFDTCLIVKWRQHQGDLFGASLRFYRTSIDDEEIGPEIWSATADLLDLLSQAVCFVREAHGACEVFKWNVLRLRGTVDNVTKLHMEQMVSNASADWFTAELMRTTSQLVTIIDKKLVPSGLLRTSNVESVSQWIFHF